MNTIKVLSDSLANQIAAGEVVERPASVVKELIENAIDAGARRIDIEVERGGMRLIRVRDNGCGIPKDDLLLSITRHATSKIFSLKDLEQIMSLGFRGEALSSIASISRLVISSRMAGHRSAWRVQAEGRHLEPSIVPCAHNDGTTVEVRDLFYNTPARRKFLRTEKTEFQQIEMLVKRMALCRFDIGFAFKHNKRIIFDLKPAHDVLSKEQRLNKIYGIGFMKQAIALDMERSGLQLSGWIGLPEFNRSQSDLQTFYVNARLIRDKVITHAVREAYGDKLYEGRYPAYALYLSLDPEAVDVNVHPTKHEVRFHDARLVHDFIVSSVAEALEKSHEVAQMKFSEANTNAIRPVSQQDEYLDKINPIEVHEEILPYNESDTSYQSDVFFHNYTDLAEEEIDETGALGKLIAQIHGKFILTENEQGIALINVLKTEQYLTEQKLLSAMETGDIETQPLLIPETINVDEKIIPNNEKILEMLKNLGLEVDAIGQTTIVLRRIPTCLRYARFPELVRDILQFISEKKNVKAQAVLSRMAKHATDKSESRLSLQEMTFIVRDLEKLLEQGQDKAIKGLWRQITLDELAKFC